jgi:hypothetical protein
MGGAPFPSDGHCHPSSFTMSEVLEKTIMPWQTLDIAPTSDEREIRRAYARQLKSRQHEEDAEFSERLRWAYEIALALARTRGNFSEDAQTILESLESLADKTGHLPEIRDTSIPLEETLEDLLHALCDLLATKGIPDEYHGHGSIFSVHFTLQPNEYLCSEYRLAQALYEKWERIRIHPQLEGFAGREVFSERLAVLLAGHWPQSALLWPQARDFFAWHPPLFSDDSTFGQALHFLFDHAGHASNIVWNFGALRFLLDEAEAQRIKVREKKGLKGWIYPGRLLMLALSVSKMVFTTRHMPEPDTALVLAFLRDLHEITKLALRFLLGFTVLFAGWCAIILGMTRKIRPMESLGMFLGLHFLGIVLLPHTHEVKVFANHCLQYRTGTARFFVIYFWMAFLFIPAIVVPIVIHRILN